MKRALLLAATFVVGCAHAPSAPLDFSSEDAAVIRAVLQPYCIDTDHQYILSDSASRAEDEDAPALRRFNREALVSVRARNASNAKLPSNIACSRVRVVAEAEINASFKALATPATDPLGWDGFFAKFPGTAALVHMSLPGYSLRGDVAVVHIATGRGSLAWHGAYVQLRKRGGVWSVEKDAAVWAA